MAVALWFLLFDWADGTDVPRVQGALRLSAVSDL